MTTASPPRLIVFVAADALRFVDAAGTQFVARGKWFEFYRLLILRLGQSVDGEALCSLKSWSDDSLDNGREVARHLQSKKISKLSHPTVTSTKVTQDWCVAPQWTIRYEQDAVIENGAIFKPDAEAYAAVRFASAIDPMPWAHAAIEALLLFYSGETSAAFVAAEAALRAAASDDLKAVSYLMCLRIGPRLAVTDTLLDVLEDYTQALKALPHSHLADHARLRLELYSALHAPPEDWCRIVRRLDAAAAAPSPVFDPVMTAFTLNYAAVTHRRLGQLALAARQIVRAVIHAVAAGDLYLLQAVLFNFGLVFADLAGAGDDQQRNAEQAIAALNLVSRITRTHRLGNDSAQNELAIADILIRQGDVAGATRYCDEARAIIARSESVYDAAVLAHRELRLEGARFPDRRHERSFATAVEHCVLRYEEAERGDLARMVSEEFKPSARLQAVGGK